MKIDLDVFANVHKVRSVYIQYSAKSAKDVANNKLKVNDKLIGITVRLE